MIYREATIADIPGMHTVRVSVQENRLSDPTLITPAEYETFITQKGKGWVYETDNQIAGFAIADLEGHNIWALFVHPSFEKQGIGRRLHHTMLRWYFAQTQRTIWLSTAPGTRAAGFYPIAGWKEAGSYGKNEMKFEMTYEDWCKIYVPAP